VPLVACILALAFALFQLTRKNPPEEPSRN
jgi:hypothetical protein